MKTSENNRLKNKPNFFQKPLFGLIYWSRIDILDGVKKTSAIYEKAESAATGHPSPKLPAFTFTESKVEWVLLYDLAREGQIMPKVMRNMKRADLYFLAGHASPHPALIQPKERPGKVSHTYFWDDTENKWNQAAKLQGNAARAKLELERRNFIWTSFFVIMAALLGGIASSKILG